MPVGTLGTVKGVDVRPPARNRRPDDPGQHLSPRASARRGNGRGPRRPARVHGLGRPDSHRQRRLPGLQPRRPNEGRRSRRPISARTSTAPPSNSRPSAPSRFRNNSAATVAMVVRPRRRAAERPRGRRRRHAAQRPLGRALPGGGHAASDQALLRDRARRARCRAPRRICRTTSWRLDFRRLRHRRPERRRTARRDVRRARRHHSPAAAPTARAT